MASSTFLGATCSRKGACLSPCSALLSPPPHTPQGLTGCMSNFQPPSPKSCRPVSPLMGAFVEDEGPRPPVQGAKLEGFTLETPSSSCRGGRRCGFRGSEQQGPALRTTVRAEESSRLAADASVLGTSERPRGVCVAQVLSSRRQAEARRALPRGHRCRALSTASECVEDTGRGRRWRDGEAATFSRKKTFANM